jgi:hypothetical protein
MVDDKMKQTVEYPIIKEKDKMKRPLKNFHSFIKRNENIFNGKFHETNKLN